MIEARKMKELAQQSIVDVSDDVDTELDRLEGEIRNAAFQGLFWTKQKHPIINDLLNKTPRNTTIASTFVARLVDAGYTVNLSGQGYVVRWS